MGNHDPVRHPGNQALFRALDLSILSVLVGLPLHVHAEGLRGTGKTTIMRSVRQRLPRIQRIKGCVYNCLPGAPHCPEHRSLPAADLLRLGTEWVPMPFREISHSSKIGTVVGSIDLGRITSRRLPEAALLPGCLPQAHRGIVFIDEINRLADTAPELADILLDVMGTKPGRLQVEETGLPGVDIPISVSVWAASNPDEDPGPLEDIRKQLSDRFDFVIAMERPATTAVVRDILRSSRERQMVFSVATTGGLDKTPPAGQEQEQEAVALPHDDGSRAGAAVVEGGDAAGPGLEDWLRLGEAVRRVECPPRVEDVIASIYVDFGLESLRGIEAIHLGSRMNCVLAGREVMNLADVAAVAPGALHHRLDISTLARVADYLQEKSGAGDGDPQGDTGIGGGEPPGRAMPETSDGSMEEVVIGSSGLTPGASSDAGAGPVPASAPSGRSPWGQGAEAASLNRDSSPGWRFLWPLLGRGWRRGRPLEALTTSTEGLRPPAAGSPGTGSSRRSTQGGHGSAGFATGQAAFGPAANGSGGRGASGQGLNDDAERPVPPPHAARPLAEILKGLDLTALDPPGPRIP